MDNIEKLMKLKDLFESGVLTKEELEAEKKKLLHCGNHENEIEEQISPEQGYAQSKEIEKKKTLVSREKKKTGYIGPVIAGIIVLGIGLTVLFNSKSGNKQHSNELRTESISHENSYSGNKVVTAEEYILNTASDLHSLLSDIWANELRAKSKYVGSSIIAKLNARWIENSNSGYRYRVSCESDSFYINTDYKTLKVDLLTSDQVFYNLDYPCIIYVQGIISDIYESYQGYHLNLTSINPLMVKQNGKYIVYGLPSDSYSDSFPGGLDDDGLGADGI